jgi:transcriptional regulator with XRE-family HTH domain
MPNRKKSENEKLILRVNQVLTTFGLNEQKIGQLTKRSQGVIYGYMLGKEEIPDEFIREVLTSVKQLREPWFRYGEGKMSDTPIEMLSSTKDYVIKRGVHTCMIDRIVKVRNDLGLSRKELALKMGIKVDTQTSIENYRQNPSLSYLELIDEAGINPYYILKGKGSRTIDGARINPDVEDELRADLKEAKLTIRNLNKLNQDEEEE